MNTRQVTNSLREFVGGADWFYNLLTEANYYDQPLLECLNSVRWCGDERPPLSLRNVSLGAAAFGGAGSFFLKFLQLGLPPAIAWSAVQLLYSRMGWGRPEIHNDTHGDPRAGCGFLAKAQQISEVVFELMPIEIGLVSVKFDPVEMFAFMVNGGANVVTLTEDHKLGMAKFLLNFVIKTTVSPAEKYANDPTFVSDVWLVNSEHFTQVFNEVGLFWHLPTLSREELRQWHVIQELATGLLLGALLPTYDNLYVAS